MANTTHPENGALVKFRRKDDEEWRQGEFDAENQLFIEIYAPSLTTHNFGDILQWEYEPLDPESLA